MKSTLRSAAIAVVLSAGLHACGDARGNTTGITASQVRTGAPVAVAAGGSIAEGTSQALCRADHVHSLTGVVDTTTNQSIAGAKTFVGGVTSTGAAGGIGLGGFGGAGDTIGQLGVASGVGNGVVGLGSGASAPANTSSGGAFVGALAGGYGITTKGAGAYYGIYATAAADADSIVALAAGSANAIVGLGVGASVPTNQGAGVIGVGAVATNKPGVVGLGGGATAPGGKFVGGVNAPAATFTSGWSGDGPILLTPQASMTGIVDGELWVHTTSGVYGQTNSGMKVGMVQFKRASGCATAASLAAVCATTITWAVAFADASYTATCTGDIITSGVPLGGGVTAKTGASVTFQTVAATSAAAQYTTIDCTAVHD